MATELKVASCETTSLSADKQFELEAVRLLRRSDDWITESKSITKSAHVHGDIGGAEGSIQHPEDGVFVRRCPCRNREVTVGSRAG